MNWHGGIILIPMPDTSPEDLNLRNQVAWERAARVYAGDEIREDDPELRAFVRNEFCRRLRGRRVLEIGCGPGTDAARLVEQGMEVTATDYAVEFIDVVRVRYPGLSARQMDMTAPDLPVESFDGVYGFGCFIHLPRSLADVTLKGLHQLLAPGGVLCLQLIQSSKGIAEYTIDSWAGDPQCSMLFTCYDQGDIQLRLQNAGFHRSECVAMPASEVYDKMPRLVERGITGYLVFEYRGDPG